MNNSESITIKFDSIKEANYLPMELDSFKQLFEIPIETGEIEHCIVKSNEKGRYVFAYLMDNTIYQAADDEFKLYK
ncbi:hypothetical protein [Vibrio owensii]|uniref:hypothetical protein n=1 Tax=Vibrio harveyi group TaxID=717610 RepID=UPI003CC6BDF3